MEGYHGGDGETFPARIARTSASPSVERCLIQQCVSRNRNTAPRIDRAPRYATATARNPVARAPFGLGRTREKRCTCQRRRALVRLFSAQGVAFEARRIQLIRRAVAAFGGRCILARATRTRKGRVPPRTRSLRLSPRYLFTRYYLRNTTAVAQDDAGFHVSSIVKH